MIIYIYLGLRTFKRWKSTMTRCILTTGRYVAEAKVALEAACSKNKVNGRYHNIEEARKAFAGFDFPEEWLHYSCLPSNSPASNEAYSWLKTFFLLVGDNAPNRNDKIQIPG